MPIDPAETVIAANGKVYAAPVGSTAPTDLTTAWDAAWIDIGYVDENGVNLDPGMTVEDIRSWMSEYPIRRLVTERTMQVSFNMQQWNKDAVKLAFGGGTFTTTAGVHKYEPPQAQDLYERALGIQFSDGTDDFRWIFKRGMNVDLGEVPLTRTSLAVLSVSFGVLASTGVVPWHFLSDKASLAT